MPPLDTSSLNSISTETRDIAILSCIAVGLVISTIIASYIFFKVVKRAQRFRKDQHRQQASTAAPQSSRIETTEVPVVRLNPGMFTQKGYPSTFESGVGGTVNPFSGSPTPVSVPPTADPISRPRKWLVHKQLLSTRFNDILNNRHSPAPKPTKAAGRLRSSLSSPSVIGGLTQKNATSLPQTAELNLAMATPPRLPRSASRIHQVADTVVGAHPSPKSIPPVPLLASPNAGHFQFDFPWVHQDMTFGLVVPGSSSKTTFSGDPNARSGPLYRKSNRKQAEEGRSARTRDYNPQLRVLKDINSINLAARITREPPPPLLASNGKYPKPILPPANALSRTASSESQSGEQQRKKTTGVLDHRNGSVKDIASSSQALTSQSGKENRAMGSELSSSNPASASSDDNGRPHISRSVLADRPYRNDISSSLIPGS